VAACPSSSRVTSIGGETGPPATATRIGWATLPNLTLCASATPITAS